MELAYGTQNVVTPTFIINIFLVYTPCLAMSHMYRMRRVLPHPVSPMITTGIPHLKGGKQIGLQ